MGIISNRFMTDIRNANESLKGIEDNSKSKGAQAYLNAYQNLVKKATKMKNKLEEMLANSNFTDADKKKIFEAKKTLNEFINRYTSVQKKSLSKV